MNKLVQPPEEHVIIEVSQGTEKPEKASCGKNNRNPLPKMLTHPLLQSKDLLIASNTHKASESPDSLALCVGKFEGKKQRIGVRLSIAERQALEITAKENNMTLSTLICRVAQIFAHQKSA